MAVELRFPKKEDDLVATVSRMLTDGEIARKREKIKWILTSLYLQGTRNYENVNWAQGTVTVNYTGMATDELNFRYEGILEVFQTELGRMSQLDITPVVKSKGQGLDDLQHASTAQIVLNHQMSSERVEDLKQQAMPVFLKTGTLILGVFDSPVAGPHVELIPSWELSSIPAYPVMASQADGYIRTRWLTEEWLKSRNFKISSGDNLEFIELPIGLEPSEGMTGAGTEMLSSLRANQSSLNKKETQKWFRFTEIWERDRDTNKLLRYIGVGGKKRLIDIDYSGEPIPMPINIAHYIDVGGFYGRGLVDQKIPLNSEIEFMLSQLFANVENFDQFGYLCISSQMGLSREEIMEARSTDKVLIYQPEVYDSNMQAPFVLQPSNSGKAPVDIVNIGLGLMQEGSSQSALFRGDAPGRVDNARGLSFLYETANIPLSSPTEAFSSCMIETYKSLLWLTRSLWTGDELVGMTMDDDLLVGVKYDAHTGRVALTQSAIPLPDEVDISIGSKTPVSPSQQRADLMDHLEKGLITPREYRVKSRELGLGLPLGNEYEWQSYRRAKLENVVLYGNGKVPGEVVYSDNDFHEVHLEVLLPFMARPEYYLASPEVRAAFEDHKKKHEQGLGQYPEAMPYPEEAAMGAMPGAGMSPMVPQGALSQGMAPQG